ncbi:MAG TPA: sigma-70 family RNA polymerase sigma factor [Dehalococcoidia bacterium]|nr:sigma-70 family RNA polymerase sigma factor [Dehalococcoidia bacterium]
MVNPPQDAALATADESALIERARHGDLDAFNDLVELHQRAVYNLCLRMIGNAAAAEDSAQEAFISAWRGLAGYRGGAFRSWLMRIAANACTDELRRRARRPALSLDVPPPGADEPIDVPDASEGPETVALRHEHQAAIQAALLRLPEDQRLAVVMCDIQGFAYDEIAAAMRVSIGTVKSRISRGRDKLRAELGRPEQSSGQERHMFTGPDQDTAGKRTRM